MGTRKGGENFALLDSEYLRLDGGNSPTGSIDWNGQNITNMGNLTGNTITANSEFVAGTTTFGEGFITDSDGIITFGGTVLKQVGRIGLQDGTNLLPALYFEPDTGIYQDSADTIDFTIAGTWVGGVDSSNDWYFGSAGLAVAKDDGTFQGIKYELNDANTYINEVSSEMSFTDAVTGTKTLAELAAGGGGVSFGLVTEMPYTNAATDDFDYSSNLTFDGSTLTIAGLVSQTIFTSNVIYGSGAGTALISGALRNTFTGFDAGIKTIKTDDNSFYGYNAGLYNIGSNNTVVGSSAFSGANLTDRGAWDSITDYAVDDLVVHNDVGYISKVTPNLNHTPPNGTYWYTGSPNNVLIGGNTGKGITRGLGFNTIVGYNAGDDNKTGNSNTLIGFGAGGGTGATFTNATFVGYQAGVKVTSGTNNLLFGYNSGANLTTGNDSVFFSGGVFTVDGNNNIAIARNALYQNVSGDRNIAVGFQSNRRVLSNDNVAVGYSANSGGVTPSWNSGVQNAMYGNYAGQSNISGSANSYFGFDAGRYQKQGARNTFVGYGAGRNILSNSIGGTDNVFIGYRAGYQESFLNDQLIISNAITKTPLIYGRFDDKTFRVDGDTTIINSSNLGAEKISNVGNFASNWDVTGDFAVDATDATYIHSTGAGTLTQTAANMVGGTSLDANSWYVFSYKTTGYTDSGTISFLSHEVTTGVTAVATTFTAYNGTYSMLIYTNSSPGDFVISVTTDDTSDFNIDNISLKKVLGGGLNVFGDTIMKGDTWWDGDGSGLPYGNMGQDDIPTTVTINTMGVAEIVTGMSGGETNLLTFQNTQELKVTKAGRYSITWSVSFNMASGSGQEIEGAIGKGGVEESMGSAHRTIGTGNDTGNMSGSAILDLAVDDLITIMVLNESSTVDVVVAHASLTMNMVGGS